MSNKKCNDGDGVSRRYQRRSKPVKNLQEEIDFILSQEDSDDNIMNPIPVEETKTAPQEKKLVMRKSRSNAKRKGQNTVDIDMEKSNNRDGEACTTEAALTTPYEENKDKVNELPKAPIDMEAALMTTTPKTSRIFMPETPRRSARKSIRPALDYDEIIEKKMLRSAAKDTNEAAHTTPYEENKDKVNELPKVPNDMKAALMSSTPRTSRILMAETSQCSARKSIKPTLDYDEIIEKKMLRSAAKDTNEAAPTTPYEENIDKVNELPEAPNDMKAALMSSTPRTSRILMAETSQRSARKSIKQTLDYDEIIEKNMLRSAAKDTNEAAPTTSYEENKDIVNGLHKIPIDMEAALMPTTPSTSRLLMTETPRRSVRKSIRPPLDYDEIIEKKMQRSVKDTNDKDNEDAEHEPPKQKWTKADVGGVSQSRGRKSKRAAAKKRVIEEELPEKMENISMKRNKSTNSDDLSNGKEKVAPVPTPKEESSQKIITKRNTRSSTNSDDLANNEKMENVKPSNVEVEPKGESLDAIFEEMLMFKKEYQLLADEIVEVSSSIKKESSKFIFEDDQREDSENQIIEMNANKDDDLKAVNDIIELDSLEETHTKTVEVPSSSKVADEEIVEYLDENFGTYLKSNIIDLTSLGLKPIPIDTQSNEMSPLIITDDEDDEENCAADGKNELNVTFEAEESHLPMETESMQLKGESLLESDNMIMQILQISDDEVEEDVKVKKPLTVSFKKQTNDTKSSIKVVLTDPDDHNSTLLKCQTVVQPSTPKSSVSNKLTYRLPTPYKQKRLTPYKQKEQTPYKQKEPTPYKQKEPTPYKQKEPTPYKQKEPTPYKHKEPTPYKHKEPTPYKQKDLESHKQKEATPYQKNKENMNIFKINTKMTPRSMNIMNNLTTLEPKDIVLRSIRKRSKSMTINTEPNSKGVTFYSPANQTLHIEELDKLMAKNVKKQFNDSYVTKRRKRSISLDDVRIQAQTSRIPKLIPPVTKFKSNTPNKIRPGSSQKMATAASKPTTRTKMPNFAAIHQKTFNKMENLVEHVERKAERAKNLANSASKLRTASVQKQQRTPKRLDGGSVITPSKKEKPKASKKINVTSLFEDIPKPEQNPFAIAKQDEQQQQQQLQIIINNLPKPRPMNNNVIKFNQTRTVTSTITSTMTKSTKLIKKTTVSSTQTLKESNNRGGVPPPIPDSTTKLPKVQPLFNLSTSTQATSSKSSAYETKMAERRQRHMGMFKGRTAVTKRPGGGTESSKGEIIRGVRSNRRFELQMQHRKNVDQ